MILWESGTVAESVANVGGLQEVLVTLASGSIERAYHDVSVHEPLAPGDQVLLNTTAVRLRLGTGGYHFVHAVLERANSEAVSKPTSAVSSPGHLMKLKYTSLQRTVLAAEEESSPHHAVFLRHQSIDDVPVLIGELHSMLPIATAWLHYRRPNIKVAYIMSDGGALPLALSRHAAQLAEMSWLCGTVTYGQAYGGDLETMNKFTALIAARHILQADIIIVCMGPGIAGTGTPLGHTGTEVGELINAVQALGGVPIMMTRVSGAEGRTRHYGISHHALVNLRVTAACPADVPLSSSIPADMKDLVEQQLQPIIASKQHRLRWEDHPTRSELEEALSHYPLTVSTMGRTLRDDPVFYVSVGAAAEYGLRYLT